MSYYVKRSFYGRGHEVVSTSPAHPAAPREFVSVHDSWEEARDARDELDGDAPPNPSAPGMPASPRFHRGAWAD